MTTFYKACQNVEYTKSSCQLMGDGWCKADTAENTEIKQPYCSLEYSDEASALNGLAEVIQGLKKDDWVSDLKTTGDVTVTRREESWREKIGRVFSEIFRGFGDDGYL